MTCFKIWTTRDGEEIDLYNMSDNHIRNALNLLRKWTKKYEEEIVYPQFQGEMAQYYAEQAFERAEMQYDETLMWIDDFKEELKNRSNLKATLKVNQEWLS